MELWKQEEKKMEDLYVASDLNVRLLNVDY